MADVGPVDLREVRAVLAPRLAEVVKPFAGRRYGRVFIASMSEIRDAPGTSREALGAPGEAQAIGRAKLSVICEPTSEGSERVGRQRPCPERLSVVRPGSVLDGGRVRHDRTTAR